MKMPGVPATPFFLSSISCESAAFWRRQAPESSPPNGLGQLPGLFILWPQREEPALHPTSAGFLLNGADNDDS